MVRIALEFLKMSQTTLETLGLTQDQIKKAVADFKRRGWAGDAKKETTRDGADRITLVDGMLMYVDEWKGMGGRLMGGETLSLINTPVNVPLWGMGYFGGLYREELKRLKIISPQVEDIEDRFNSFLRTCLMDLDENLPARMKEGRKKSSEFDLIAELIPGYDFKNFSGFESARYFPNLRQVIPFWGLEYSGGLLLQEK